MLQVIWFKRDLRISDHIPLQRAAASGPVLCLYVIEPALWQQTDRSARHAHFIVQSLLSLHKSLRELGGALTVVRGDVITQLEAIAATQPFALHAHEETGSKWTFARDIAVTRWSRSRSINFTEYQQFGVVRRLQDRNGWAQQWLRFAQHPIMDAPPSITFASIALDTVPIATLLAALNDSQDSALNALFYGHLQGIGVDDFNAFQTGGRKAALDTIGSFLTLRGQRYHRELSSPLTAYESCSRLSTHLAYGTISIAETFQASNARRAWLADEVHEHAAHPMHPVHTSATQWARATTAFESRLAWHCHFIQKLETEPQFEFENMHSAFNRVREPEFSHAYFQAWATGQTGYPFVDACMRALQHTGWLNFRMRAMLVSFAAYPLWLHWREPAQHLARLFTDYETGIHYSQMQMQSGTTGINTMRVYNPIKQGQEHDPAGIFIRRWVPELQGLQGNSIHTPWLAPAMILAQSGVVLGSNYPKPIVDFVSAVREAKARMAAVTHDADFGTEANAIQNAHGSRKSGMTASQRGVRGKVWGKAATSNISDLQLGFDFG
jgi:deoxyribodipyrimidine photo-lyase